MILNGEYGCAFLTLSLMTKIEHFHSKCLLGKCLERVVYLT